MNAVLRYEELASELGVRAIAGLSLARHTTLRVGGPAEWAFFPRTMEQAARLHAELRRGELPVRIIGAGSNLLISDQGLHAAVILTGEMIAEPVVSDDRKVFALSGMKIPGLARWAAQQGLSGLEFAEGIPAQLGGAIRMNAGAHQSSFAEVLETVHVAGDEGEVRHHRCGKDDFGYRDSFVMREQLFVLGAQLALNEGDPEQIKHQAAEFRDRRRSSQPLNERSAGCVFANWPDQSVGALIEKLGLKGLTIGGAEVSRKHGNFIVNRGNASADDIRALIDHVRETISRATGRAPRLEVEIWEDRW